MLSNLVGSSLAMSKGCGVSSTSLELRETRVKEKLLGLWSFYKLCDLLTREWYFFLMLLQIPRCVPCPAGYSCGNVTQPPVPCASGFFSLQGNASCTECEAGQACTDPAQAPKHCPYGTYSLRVRKTLKDTIELQGCRSETLTFDIKWVDWRQMTSSKK